jgi:antirestriction protein ArdC
MKTLEELRGNIADVISADMKKGEVLWHDQRLPSLMPRSLISGREFGGMNALYLMNATVAKGFDSPYWIARPGDQRDVSQEKKIWITKDEKGTKIEHWERKKDENGNESLIVPRTVTYFNVQQVHHKSLEQFSPSCAKEDTKETPNYDAANAILKALDISLPKEKNLKEYHAALKSSINEIAKDTPKLDQVLTDDLKKLRLDMGTSFLTLSLGMGVPETDKSLPMSSWASSISHDPRQLASAARDAHILAKDALEKGLTLSQSQEKEMEKTEKAQMRSPIDLKIGDKVLCKRDDRKFSGEVKSVENGIIIANMSPNVNGEHKEYKNLHERGWTYEILTLEQGKAEEQGNSKKIDVLHLKEGQEVSITSRENGNNQFTGTITKIDNETSKIYVSTSANGNLTFGPDSLEKKWQIEALPYEQTLAYANDKVGKLKESKVILPESKTTVLSHHEKFQNGNVRLLDETAKYAIIGLGKEKITPLIASITSIGEENMKKLRETKGKDSTVLFEKTNGKITVKTPKEIVQEKSQKQELARERS